uniref:Uncharacterized protein n=2 Tax=Palpitomonas bilix TaxID=652834 RepID=A0A7S3GK72_9EUKA|mmetsp:Transcript_6765/g.17015  ORF Transcript_6765/g.17015 Transcript_6765/m.17015 type:complete len:144 (+) Transcript_6765:268-699(+)
MACIPHLSQRAAFAVVAKASASKLAEVAKTKGWTHLYSSSSSSSFNEDMGVSFTPEQMADAEGAPYNYGRRWRYGSEAPGLSVFAKDGEGNVYHTYSTFAAGLATVPTLSLVHSLLDVTPEGRAESGKHPMWWVKHKEEYEHE